MRGPLSEAAELYNYIEIGIWCTIAAVVAFVALRRTGPVRRSGLLASVTLVAFGLSDYAEIRTGGEWWRPWWLLAWKAACVITLLGLLVISGGRRGDTGAALRRSTDRG
jgi:hypothetical protein